MFIPACNQICVTKSLALKWTTEPGTNVARRQFSLTVNPPNTATSWSRNLESVSLTLIPQFFEAAQPDNHFSQQNRVWAVKGCHHCSCQILHYSSFSWIISVFFCILFLSLANGDPRWVSSTIQCLKFRTVPVLYLCDVSIEGMQTDIGAS